MEIEKLPVFASTLAGCARETHYVTGKCCTYLPSNLYYHALRNAGARAVAPITIHRRWPDMAGKNSAASCGSDAK